MNMFADAVPGTSEYDIQDEVGHGAFSEVVGVDHILYSLKAKAIKTYCPPMFRRYTRASIKGMAMQWP